MKWIALSAETKEVAETLKLFPAASRPWASAGWLFPETGSGSKPNGTLPHTILGFMAFFA
jgi:hypothetical protein